MICTTGISFCPMLWKTFHNIGGINFLFCGNHDATENAAIMYLLLGCCTASDVNPREWLTNLLTRIPHNNKDYSLDLANLLPHNWKAVQKPQNAP
jgi:transposase